MRDSPSSTPRLLRSMSKAQEVADPETSPEQTPVRWMSKYKASGIGRFTKLTHRRATTQVDDNDADPVEYSTSPTSPTIRTPIDTQNVDGNADAASAGSPEQSPRAEPTAPSTLAKRMQDMFFTLPALSPSTASGSSPSNDSSPPVVPTTETEDAPSPTQNSHPSFSLSLPSFENSVFDNAWKSLWSTWDNLRSPFNKPTGSPDQPSRDQILDCIDDNNSVMMYGPLEPDESSEVEIACSEIVSISGDGEEIRTPQPCYSPLPSESLDEALAGRGPRSPPPRYVSLPADSIEESLVARGLRSPSPRFSPLSLDINTLGAPWVAHGLYSPSPRFSPLPLAPVDEAWVANGLRSPSLRFSPLPLASVDEAWVANGLRTPSPRFSPLPPTPAEEASVARGLRAPPPRFVPLPLESIDQVLMGRGGDVTGVRQQESGPGDAPEPAGVAHSPPTATPAKEYRVWLPSPTKISVQTMWWGFRVYLPPPVLDVLNNRQLEAAKRAAIITTALQWLMEHLPIALLPPQMHPGVTILRHLVPYVGYIGGLIAWSWSAIRSFDKGYGVVLTATWLLPFILIPGTWEADEVPNQNVDLQPSVRVSS